MSRQRRPISQEPVVIEVTGLAHDGRGIGRLNDKITFIFGALPGETVRAKYTSSHSRYDEATTLEVMVPSQHRVIPPCPHFGVCGGCGLQHLKPSMQIEHKQALLSEQLLHHAKVKPQMWLDPLVGTPLGYRQKARLGVRFVHKKQALLVGFREQGNNKITVIESCHVLDPRVGQKIKDLREVINALEGRECIPQIEVAIGSDEVALVFRHLNPLSEIDISLLITFCKNHDFSLYLQPGGVSTVHKVWPALSCEQLVYELKTQKLSYQFHPLDFTQVNQEINQKMVNQALALLNPTSTDCILDLFCGLGNFSLPFAQIAQQVVGVEGTSQMVERAQINAKLNDLDNVEFFAADLSQDFSHQPWIKRQYTKIVIDPPRCGAEEIVSQISRFKAKEILYISCNPATFARDAAILVHQHGFSLKKVGVIDMFPHTGHVETMGLFHA